MIGVDIEAINTKYGKKVVNIWGIKVKNPKKEKKLKTGVNIGDIKVSKN